ncbi:MAG: transposase [Actinomycetota bacterium]|nr:transposase [Actinomycetota bacterium]
MTCHDTGRLVWAGKDRNQATLGRFFDDLGEQRAAALTHVSADGAEWIHDVVTTRAPQALLCLDAFHVVAWATEALDTVRREMATRLRAGGQHDEAAALKGSRWALLKNPPNLTGDQRTTLASIAKTNGGLYRAYLLKEQLREMATRLRAGGQHDEAAALKGSRWALLKNPPNLTGDQRTTLASIAKTNGGLYRAYLLKEQLREIFACGDPTTARALLAGWIAWARRSRLPGFVRLAKTITRYRQLILNAVEHRLSNARSEATNTHLRLLTRRAYGYHSPEALIAMANLTRGGLCLPLPGRS